VSRGESRIVAVVTLRQDVRAGGVPVFPAADEAERDQMARLLAKLLRGTIHDLRNGSYVIVRHH